MIIHGKALINRSLEDVYIEIEDGIIRKISKEKIQGKIIEYGDNGIVILPGMVDIHVHMRDFKQAYKEDFYTGTKAAAAGGVCLVMDMPNTDPKNNSLEVLYKRDKLASRSAIVDYGLYYGLPNEKDDTHMYEGIAWGLKIYPEDYNNPLLLEALNYNKEKGLLTIVHPEDPEDIEGGYRGLGCELRAIAKFIELGIKYGYRIHLTHVTSVNSILLSRLAKEHGVTLDTCPHYLLLNKNRQNDPYYRVNPPLRDGYIQENLLRNLSRIRVDAIATDHAPHTLDEKRGDDPRPGFPGLETCLPILITLYKLGYLDIWDVADLYSLGPAKIIGLDMYLGSIEEGKAANMVICNIKDEFRVDPIKFHTKAKHSPFEGMNLYGKVIATIVRGEFVYRDGEFLVDRGYGENIRRLTKKDQK